jgi:hypothetical protein
MILNEADLEDIVTVTHRNQEVSDIKFSPGKNRLFNHSDLAWLFR